MEIAADRNNFPVKKNVLDEIREAYNNREPIDAGRLDDEEFEKFVRYIAPFNPGIQHFVNKFLPWKRR